MKKKFLALFFLIVVIIPLLIPVPFVYALGSPTKISTTTTDDTVFPQTVTDSKGYLHMVWMEVLPIDCSGFDCTNVWGSYQNSGIFYSRWNGDTWSAPLKISENTGFAQLPSTAVDSADTVHVVWNDTSYAGDGLQSVVYKTRNSSGTWSTIEVLARPSGTLNSWSARVAADNTNIPHIVFNANTGGNKDSIYWTRKVSGVWTTPELISKDASNNNITDTQFSDFRSDTSGNLYLTYWSWSKGIFYRKYSGGTWSTPFQVKDATLEYTRMAVTPAGEIFVTWFERSDSSIRVRWTQSGVWQSETTLTNLAEFSFWSLPIMGVTTDSKERAHVGWGEKDAGGLIDLRYRSFVPGSGWQAVQDVDLDNNDADTPFIYPDKWDNQHFAWAEKNPISNLWELMYRVAEGTIQTVGAAGATITANPGNVTYVTLAIPANALSVDTQIGIQIGPVPESVSPTQISIPRSLTFRPNGLVFNVPNKATATITYTDAEVAGSDERLLLPWIWDSLTNLWVAQVGENDTNQNTIKVDLLHFSLYGISAPIVNTTWLKPLSNEIIKQEPLIFEFQLKYADGAEVVPPAEASELTVQLKNENDIVVGNIQFGSIEFRKDERKNVYKGNLFFRKDDFPNGNYKLEVYLTGNLVGSQNFTLAR